MTRGLLTRACSPRRALRVGVGFPKDGGERGSGATDVAHARSAGLTVVVATEQKQIFPGLNNPYYVARSVLMNLLL